MNRLPSITFAIAAVFVVSGCSTLDVAALRRKPKVLEATPDNPVMDIMGLWEPGDGRGLDDLPVRGFAGQLLFLTQQSDEPAKVDGDVRIYVFDDQGTLEEQTKPIHQFDFTSEVWNRYLRSTNLGPAYQLFIPYTRRGAHEANCAIRVRFTPADGSPPVYSKMANITLPGSKSPGGQRLQIEQKQVSAAERAGHHVDPNVSPAVHQLPGGTSADGPSKTSTIQLTAARQAALASGQAQRMARLRQLMHQTLKDEGLSNEPAEQPSTSESADETPATRRYRLH